MLFSLNVTLLRTEISVFVASMVNAEGWVGREVPSVLPEHAPTRTHITLNASRKPGCLLSKHGVNGESCLALTVTLGKNVRILLLRDGTLGVSTCRLEISFLNWRGLCGSSHEILRLCL